MQWNQVDRTAKTIRLEPGTTKNKDGRTFPYDLLDELNEAIEEQWQEHQSLAKKGVLCPWVFHRNGRPIRSIRARWKAACEAAGLPGKLVHDFRRTAIRNLVRAGAPDTVAMKLSGHKTRSVFDRYNVTSEADLRDAIAKLAHAAGTFQGQSDDTGRVTQFPESF